MRPAQPIKPLNDEQRKLASDNHKLIYAMMHKMNLNEDMYDVLAIGLCNAAREYEPSKGKFSTFACTAMHRAAYNEFHIINAKKRTMNETEIRLELSREDDNGRMSEDSDRIADESYSLDDIVAAHELLDLISSKCRDDVERDIVIRRIEGYSSIDIGKIHGITQQGILLKIKRIRKAIAV